MANSFHSVEMEHYGLFPLSNSDRDCDGDSDVDQMGVIEMNEYR